MDACFAYIRAKTVCTRRLLSKAGGGASILHGNGNGNGNGKWET